MATTAYASLVSLLNTLDQIHSHPLVSTFFDINHTKSLSEKVNYFVDFVEKYSDADSSEVEDLVRRIADAAHEAENIVEVHAADQIRGRESPSFLYNLQKIMEKMESMKEEVIKVKEEIEKSRSSLLDLPPSSLSSSSLGVPPATAEATILVGFDDYKHKLFNDLTGYDVARQIISITGMGGIGKTTLARNLYENSQIVRHFNVRVWVTVSQESSARKVFLQALSCLESHSADLDAVDDQQLSLRLHKKLYNRRYLIILDDVWRRDIWNEIKFYFPENNNGSRIVVTTRESKLVDYIGSSALALEFLNEETSWKLFCEKAFPKQGFPPKLVAVARKIVKKCRGLPLAIAMIGGLLGKSQRTLEHWERIAKDKSLILNLEENKPLSILYLSYKYLPVCLKSCFLHFGLYPEDFKIEMSHLIKHWIAEGFIKPNRGQSLEEVAEGYINELVDRNLILRHSSSISRRNSFSLHDLVRDLCVMIGEKENFFYVQRSIYENLHFIADQTMIKFYFEETYAPASILDPFIVPVATPIKIKTRLLRVLCFNDRHCYVHEEVNMRFLEDRAPNNQDDYLLSSLVSQFWSLQTFILEKKEVIAPAEIWNMSQLRHIIFRRIYLPPPPHSDDDVYVLQNLQTLGTVCNLAFTEDVCKKIPNIKELTILYISVETMETRPDYHLENLGCFNKLESLYFDCYAEACASASLHNIKFPSSLKELTLTNCELEWSYMAVIASLPHLQFLHLDRDAFAATEWIFVDEKFVSLKELRIYFSYVTKWVVKSSNFPVLEKVYMYDLSRLDEIPSGIGEISTLQEIVLRGCKESVNISAVEILHEQESFENLGLRLSITLPYSTSDEAALLREKIEELGLTCQNLSIEDKDPY